MIYAPSHVDVDASAKELMITISPRLQPWQRTALYTWITAWTILGAFMLMYSFKLAGDELSAVIIYLVFWAYFLYTVGRSLAWNLVGAEYLRIEKGEVTYKRSWRGYGKGKVYDGDTIKELGILTKNTRSIAQSFGEVFWSYGGERVGFEYLGRKVVFGMKLSEEDAGKVVKTIKRALKSKD